MYQTVVMRVVMGLWLCCLAFGFRFRGCVGLCVTGDGEAGSFCRGGSDFWDLGTGALVISDCKCRVCLYLTMAGVSVLGS